MFRDFGEGGGNDPLVVIHILEGDRRPESVQEIQERSLGQLLWDQQDFFVQIPIKKSGVGRWLAWVEGERFHIVPISGPMICPEGKYAKFDMRRTDQ